MKVKAPLAVVAALFVSGALPTDAQRARIGIIDFYGRGKVAESAVRAALTVHEGDSITLPTSAKPRFQIESEGRLAQVPGVARGHVTVVCCERGDRILYVGIEPRGTDRPTFRAAPTGRAKLPGAVAKAGRDFTEAFMRAVERGDAADDVSQGHSLMHDSAARAVQERFLEFARNLAPLRTVLRTSSDAEQRALAAQVLGYATDKYDVVDDLSWALDDPSESVRNNANRALWAIAQYASATPSARLHVPVEPLVRLLSSPVWTDRNKTSLTLMELTSSRDPALLSTLRTKAIVPLTEIARWKSDGHAFPAFLILGRIAGRDDEKILEAWTRGDRESVIVDAQTVRSGNPVLPGWYADPEAHVFDGQYWIFPTYSAPYDEQIFMDAFSSKDLITWTKHPRVLDVANVTWARRAVWAPSIVEKEGWYYLFFGANDIQNDQQIGGIGVGRARSPQGPFKDYLGKPLIDKFHNGAQPIDQMVFKDRDGAYYILYGGWRHCNIAKLNAEFTGFVPFSDGATFKEITPTGYVEGAYMLLKDDKYYLMWSEGGWTGPNYAVAYAVGTTPFGPFERIGKILQQDSTVATGAGHHSVLHSSASDKWYIVYHRRPLGETDRNHRVVSVDELRFDARGNILPVQITKAGVQADPLRR